MQGKSPKTVDMYSRSPRQVAVFFDTCPDALTAAELKAYFLSLVQIKSWSAVKITRNAIKFFYRHVLDKPWEWIPIVKPPVVQALQDVLSLSASLKPVKVNSWGLPFEEDVFNGTLKRWYRLNRE